MGHVHTESGENVVSKTSQYLTDQCNVFLVHRVIQRSRSSDKTIHMKMLNGIQSISQSINQSITMLLGFLCSSNWVGFIAEPLLRPSVSMEHLSGDKELKELNQ